MKRAYLTPTTEVAPVITENSMLANSPIGGVHNDAEDDETLTAKQNSFFDSEEDIWTDRDSF